MAETKGIQIMASCPEAYSGPERRKIPDRRSDECMYHEAHEVRFDNLEKKNKIICKNVETVKDIVDTKVPMKLFYSTAGGFFVVILIILGVQWGTYVKVNDMALSHATAMGTINKSIAEIKLEVKHGNQISVQARTTIKEALIEQTKHTNEKMNSIQRQIEKLHKQENGG